MIIDVAFLVMTSLLWVRGLVAMLVETRRKNCVDIYEGNNFATDMEGGEVQAKVPTLCTKDMAGP